MTLEQYFDENWNRSPYPVTDHTIRVAKDIDGTYTFYIHPTSVDGTTLDFSVATNTLTALGQ